MTNLDPFLDKPLRGWSVCLATQFCTAKWLGCKHNGFTAPLVLFGSRALQVGFRSPRKIGVSKNSPVDYGLLLNSSLIHIPVWNAYPNALARDLHTSGHLHQSNYVQSSSSSSSSSKSYDSQRRWPRSVIPLSQSHKTFNAVNLSILSPDCSNCSHPHLHSDSLKSSSLSHKWPLAKTLGRQHGSTTFGKREASSFIRQVKDQLKTEMEANAGLRQAVEEFQKLQTDTSSDPLADFARRKEKVKIFCNSVNRSTRSTVVKFSSRAFDCFSSIYRVAQNYHIVAKPFSILGAALSSICSVLAKTIDQSSEVLSNLLENDSGASARQRIEFWRQQQQQRTQHLQSVKRPQVPLSSDDPVLSPSSVNIINNFDSADWQTVGEKAASESFALVLSHDSTWDRFGSRLREMPFLNNFFENPMVERIFGETDQAAAIRQVKRLEPTFRVSDLIETVEHIIAPHIVEIYLKGDVNSIRLHCGEAASATLLQSVSERTALQYTMDPTILILRNVELKGAILAEGDGAPWFIFSFSAQQINCMLDKLGKVVVGTIDDVREVLYVIAVSPHPSPETPGLHYPWIIKEFAILGNSPSW